MNRGMWLCVVVLLVGCARGSARVGAAAPKRSDIVPVADYHVHLLGPYALPLPDPLPPEVQLPPELHSLLVARAHGSAQTPPARPRWRRSSPKTRSC